MTDLKLMIVLSSEQHCGKEARVRGAKGQRKTRREREGRGRTVKGWRETT